MVDDAEIPEQGDPPWMRIATLFMSLALLAGGAYVGVTWGSSRWVVKVVAALVIIGLFLFWFSLFVKGASFLPDRIRTWSYYFWILGGVRENFPTEIQAIALGETKGKYTAGLRMKDGSLVTLCYKNTSIKETQAFIDKIAKRYAIEVALEVTDPEKLKEAAILASSQRWWVTCYSAAKLEYLDLHDTSGTRVGQIAYSGGWFSKTVDASESNVAEYKRWAFQKASDLKVLDQNMDAGTITFKKNFMSTSGTFIWRKPGAPVWCAILETEQDNRTMFSMKLYRGLPEGAGSAAERASCQEAQGAHTQVAQIHGALPELAVDVADPTARDWIVVSLSALWMLWRPDYTPPERKEDAV